MRNIFILIKGYYSITCFYYFDRDVTYFNRFEDFILFIYCFLKLFSVLKNNENEENRENIFGFQFMFSV